MCLKCLGGCSSVSRKGVAVGGEFWVVPFGREDLGEGVEGVGELWWEGVVNGEG